MFLISWVVCAAAQTRLYINIDQVGSHLLPLAIPKLMGETADPELGRGTSSPFFRFSPTASLSSPGVVSGFVGWGSFCC